MSRRSALRLLGGIAAGVAALAILTFVEPASLRAVDPIPAEPPSVTGQAQLHHLQFATSFIQPAGSPAYVPIDLADHFQAGSPKIYVLIGWESVPPGTELRLRIFQGERLVGDSTLVVATQRHSGYVIRFDPAGGLSLGHYSVELDYNRVPDEIATFDVTADGAAPAGPAGPTASASAGAGETAVPSASPVAATSPAAPTSAGPATTAPSPGSSGGPTAPASLPPHVPVDLNAPVPYADAASVLVVTREAALRAKLGPQTDAVLTAARRVGTLADLDADGVAHSSPATAVPAVQRLLKAGGYRYLLILGNDDVVAYPHFTNPMAASDAPALQGWDLPADWLPSDDAYTDLDADQLTIPDLPVARLPSSDDAQLLLTQLSDLVVPTGSGAFALINDVRRGPAEVVLDEFEGRVPLERHYSPPVTADAVPVTAASDRYLHVLLHGIGAAAEAWANDITAWTPPAADSPSGEWHLQEADQRPVITIDFPGNKGIVQIGACYGAWTLDTIQAPSHKDADNDLSLHFLKGGSRAYVGSTHLTYSLSLTAGGPYIGGTGFDLLFWRYLLTGSSPIDAFHQTKLQLAQAVRDEIAAGEGDAAALNYKTLHEMLYLGRP